LQNPSSHAKILYPEEHINKKKRIKDFIIKMKNELEKKRKKNEDGLFIRERLVRRFQLQKKRTKKKKNG
jgi:hypothetical protein